MASARFEAIVDDFAFLEDWEDRYRYVIELGKGMAPMPEALKVPATKVDGCASQVWIHPQVEGAGQAARFDFLGTSDAMIVRGLIAVLKALYGGLSPGEVLAVDAQRELGRLELAGHLSSQRSNGLKAMVGRLRGLAEAEMRAA